MCAAVALLVSAIPAAARDVVTVHGRAEVHAEDGTIAELAGLETVLAGGRVVIGAYDDDSVPRVQLMRRDGSLRSLTAFDAPVRLPAVTFDPTGPNSGDIGGSDQSIAASGRLLLVADSWAGHGRKGSGYRIGGFDGRASRFHYCRGFGESDQFPIAVSGRAYARLACDPRARGVVVQDLERPDRPAGRFDPPRGYRLAAPEGQRPVAMAGRYLALSSFSYPRSRALQVFDWRSGREVYRVPPAALADELSFGLQSDGKIVITQTDEGGPDGSSCEPHTPLAWYSPSEPTAHPLPYRPCAHGLAIARGRIVYRGPGEFGGSALYMTDVHGRPPVRLSGSPWVTDGGFDELQPFDFDGTRIAYGEPVCLDQRVVRDTIGAIERRGYLRAVTCMARFAGRHPVEEWEDGTIAVRIRCPSGCDGDWWIETAGPHPRGVLTGGEVRVPSGTTQVLRSSQSAFPRGRAGHRPHRVRVRVIVSIAEPGGTYRRFTRTATIRTTRAT